MEKVLMNEMDRHATKGEVEFVDVVNDLAEQKPDYFKLYYEPNGKNTYPDFALYSKIHGLVFFEIKDHRIDQINSFSNNEVKYTYNDSEVKELPLSKHLTYKLLKEFQASNINIPISELFVFPNISEKEVRAKFGFDTTESNRYIFKEDLFYLEQFEQKLADNRKFRYKEKREYKEAALLCIQQKLASSIVKKEKDLSIQTVLFKDLSNHDEDDLMVLNNNQEVTYRSFIRKRGFRFLKGHAGTGKTVLLLMRAEQLAKEHEKIKILITYFTSQLDGLFQKLSKKYPNISAQRLTQFCQDNIKRELNIGKDKQKWEEYYKECLNIISDKSHALNGYFNYILVDEGQDFTPTQGAIIEKLAVGSDYRNKQILIAFDDFQALHSKGEVDTPLTFKGKQRGRVKVLKSSFRTPLEIAQKAQRLIDEPITSVRPVENSFNHIRLDPDKDPIDYINRIVPLILEKRKIELQDIAIIYPSYKYMGQRMDMLLKKLEPPHYFYKTEYKKAPQPQRNKKITVLSSTYSKGLEFKVVFLVLFDEVPPKSHLNGSFKSEEHLYVSMTRATHYLVILTQKENELINLVVSDEQEVIAAE